MKRQTILLNLSVFALMSLTSCSHLYEGRTFIDEMERESDGLFVAGRDFQVVPGDSGQAYRSDEEIMMRTPASYRSKDEFLERQTLQGELARRENNLSEMDRREYQRVSPYLESESERIYYLTLSPRDRSQYIHARIQGGIQQDVSAISPEVTGYGRSPASFDLSHTVMAYEPEFSSFREISSVPDITLGMDKRTVTQSMGQPTRVEVAGNPRHENERWIYMEGRKQKFVYFEGGRVNGWVLE